MALSVEESIADALDGRLVPKFYWDVIAVTCPTARSALGVKEELLLMQKNGLFASITSLLSIEDPDAGIGSGGATLNAILVVAEYLSAKRGFPVLNSEVLKDSHILIVHNGRSYPYEPCGKAFIPLPRSLRTVSDGCKTSDSFVVNTNLGNLLTVVDGLVRQGCDGDLKKDTYGTWVCSTDAVIRVAPNVVTCSWKMSSINCVLFTVPCDPNYATEHGVVRIAEAEQLSSRHAVEDILYRRPLDHLQQCLLENGKVPVVCGIVFLSPLVTESLFSLQSRVPIDSCTYLGSDSGSSALQVSLFFDILAAMARNISADDFVNGDCGKTYGLHRAYPDQRSDSMIRVRSLVWNELRKYTMEAVILNHTEYEYWPEHMPASSHFDILRRSYGEDNCDIINVNSALSRFEIVGGDEERNDLPTVFQNCVLRGTVSAPIRIGRGTILSGVEYIHRDETCSLSIPENSFLMCTRLRRSANKSDDHNNHSSTVHVLFGIRDNLFAAMADQTATICNVSWSLFLKKTDIAAEELWDISPTASERTLFTARLFPINGSIGDVLWFNDTSKIREIDELKSKWTSLERVSMADILGEVDVPAEFAFRRDDIRLQLITNDVRHVILEDGQQSLLPLFEQASHETWVSRLLDEMDDMASNCDMEGPGRAARIFANIADLLGCLAARERGFRSGPAANKEWAHVLETLITQDEHYVRNGVRDLSKLRKNWMDSPQRLIRAARHYEAAAQILTRNAVATANYFVRVVSVDTMPDFGVWVVCECPARVDLFGGWTDTPPICYELGGSVVNASILLNGKRPIGAKVRRISSLNIQIHSDTDSLLLLNSLDDVQDYKNPSSSGALVKTCLLYTGILELKAESSLTEQLEKYGGGLEIHTWSRLPLGSGLGTSSILAGAILTSLWLAIGKSVDRISLVHAVLCVEQMMTTGGGWQDQVGGLIGGIIHGESKLTYDSDGRQSSSSGRLKVEVQRLPLDVETMDYLRRHLVVVYTGTARLARNLLQNVLRNWYCRDADVCNTFRTLYSQSYKCVDAIKRGNLEEIGDFLNRYWELKKALTPGAEPDHVTAIMERLKPHVYGQLLCGAGGGGHLVLLSRQPDAHSLINDIISEFPQTEDVAVMETSIDEEGLCAYVGEVKVVIP